MDEKTKRQRLELIVARHHAMQLRHDQNRIRRRRPRPVWIDDEQGDAADNVEAFAMAANTEVPNELRRLARTGGYADA
jgi:hypothetical protein